MKKTPCVWEEGLAGEFWQKGRLPFPVYDVHGHMGLHPAIYMSHAAPETMVRHLRRAGAPGARGSHADRRPGRTHARRH